MLKKIKVFLEMIKFEHSLFALPFAYMGALLGSVTMVGSLPSWAAIGWVTLAMIGARSAAMGLNRLIDKAIDLRNPRTADRAIPAGKLSVKETIIFIIASFILLFVATFNLSDLAMKLLPVAVFFLVIYSYTKRFTWACHIVLGLTIALAPLGGWVAITGSINWTALVFYITIACWTAGFDIVYACQDVDYDKREGLHSIPARFGLTKALWIARLFHVVTAVGFVMIFVMTELSWWYFAGILLSYAMLFYQHYIISPQNLTRVNTSFFTMNGTLSVVVFVFALVDMLVNQ